jgi:hypothetical protein
LYRTKHIPKEQRITQTLTIVKKVSLMKTAALLPGNPLIVTSGSLSGATICGAKNTLVVKGHNFMVTVTSEFLLLGGMFRVFYKTRSFFNVIRRPRFWHLRKPDRKHPTLLQLTTLTDTLILFPCKILELN